MDSERLAVAYLADPSPEMAAILCDAAEEVGADPMALLEAAAFTEAEARLTRRPRLREDIYVQPYRLAAHGEMVRRDRGEILDERAGQWLRQLTAWRQMRASRQEELDAAAKATVQDVLRDPDGQWAVRQGRGTSAYARPSVIRQARAILVERDGRRAAASVAEAARTQPIGSAAQRLHQARRAAARARAEEYARNHQLVQSKYASLVEGPGAQEDICWPYSKSYGRPAKFRNAGWRVEGRYLIVEDSRGREVLREPISVEMSAV